MRRWPAYFVVAPGALLAACSVLLDPEQFEGVEDGGARAREVADHRAPAPSDGSTLGVESGPADGALDSAGGPACPSGEGPPSLRVSGPGGQGAYCVDATEVSNASYARFLASVSTPRADLLAGRPCAWKTTHVPAGWNPSGDRDAFPVVKVDFCDAYAYCAWAGKRLCGRIGGGASSLDALGDGAKSQWFSACSQGGANRFPYGARYDARRCNGPEALLPALAAVGTFAGCVGGYPGLFDMSGNVAEWEDACSPDSAAGQEDTCAVRGGTYARRNPLDINGDGLACDARLAVARKTIADDIGIRCCAL